MAPTPLPDSAGSHAAASLGADFDPFTPDVIRDPQYYDGLIREMSLGLAPVVVRRLLPILRTIAYAGGIGVQFGEQHVQFVLDLADRAYLMNRGRIAMSGTGAEL